MKGSDVWTLAKFLGKPVDEIRVTPPWPLARQCLDKMKRMGTYPELKYEPGVAHCINDYGHGVATSGPEAVFRCACLTHRGTSREY